MESDNSESNQGELCEENVLKRGPKTIIDHEKLLQALIKYKDDLFCEEPGKETQIVPIRNSIWEKIATETQVKARTIHAYVFNSKYPYQNELKRAKFGVIDRKRVERDSTLNSTTSSSVSEGVSTINCEDVESADVQVEFCVSQEVMRAITQITEVDRGKFDRKFKTGDWQYEITSQIFDCSKVSCGFKYKNSYVNFRMDYGSISGHCDCGSQLSLKIIQANESGVKFKGTISQIGSSGRPCKKGFCRKSVRLRIGKKLKRTGQGAHAYRVADARKRMKLHDPEPGNLPNPGVIRNCLMEVNAKDLIAKDPVTALRMMDGKQLENVIHALNVTPFRTLYWTRNQHLTYRHYTKTEAHPKLGLDATSDLFQTITDLHGNQGGALFLYSMVMRYNDKIMPAFQWIAEAHRTIDITPNIERYHAETETPPPWEVVVDGSRSLLNGTTRAYTDHRNISSYAAALFQHAKPDADLRGLPPLPRCFIREDGAHKMKIYVNLCKNLKIFRVRTLYKAWVGHLLNTTDLKHLKKVIYRLFIVSMSQYTGTLKTNEPSLCQEALTYLERCATETGKF